MFLRDYRDTVIAIGRAFPFPSVSRGVASYATDQGAPSTLQVLSAVVPNARERWGEEYRMTR